jgi:GntR family transcriptional repressor for pyruvate dehydrogenase complex
MSDLRGAPRPSFTPIGRANLVDDIVRRLEAEIAGGALRPGDQLPPERDLCVQLRVSRTSLRAAVQRLAERGLVSVEMGRGTFVRQPSARQLSERLALLLRLDQDSYWKIAEARHAVEGRIAALAARRRRDDHLAALRWALEGMDAAGDEALLYIARDEEFHLALATAAGNEVLAALSQNLQAMARRMRHEIFAAVSASRGARHYHWLIFEAIARRAPGAARRAMEGHLREMEEYVRGSLADAAGPGLPRRARVLVRRRDRAKEKEATRWHI